MVRFASGFERRYLITYKLMLNLVALFARAQIRLQARNQFHRCSLAFQQSALHTLM